MEARVVVSDKVLSRRVGNEVVLVNLVDDEYYSLNSVAARVFELASEPVSATAIVDGIVAEFSVDRSVAEQDVQELIAELRELQILEAATDW